MASKKNSHGKSNHPPLYVRIIVMWDLIVVYGVNNLKNLTNIIDKNFLFRHL